MRFGECYSGGKEPGRTGAEEKEIKATENGKTEEGRLADKNKNVAQEHGAEAQAPIRWPTIEKSVVDQVDLLEQVEIFLS
jgi:hypothetical protein